VTFTYDASTTTVRSVDAISQPTNMTYDTAGPHPRPVELNPPTPDEPDGDQPVVVTRSD
jgi:hypothetical protein